MANADTVALISLSHDMRTVHDDVRVPAQRGGVHFDVVFRAPMLAQAQDTVLAHLRDVLAFHQAQARHDGRRAPNGADIFAQVVVSGAWFVVDYPDGRASRLLLVADGWSYRDRVGRAHECGTLVASDAPQPAPVAA